MNIESEANKDLALESEDAENVVGGTRKKKVTAKHHVVTKGGNHMIVEQPLGETSGTRVSRRPCRSTRTRGTKRRANPRSLVSRRRDPLTDERVA